MSRPLSESPKDAIASQTPVKALASMSAPRRNRLILVLALFALIFASLWFARGALVPYVLALVMAYVLLPAVNWLEARLRRLFRGSAAARPVAILLVYILGAGLVALFVSLVVPVIAQQLRLLWESRVELANQTQGLFERTMYWYRETVPAAWQEQIAKMLQDVAATLTKALQTGITRTVSLVTGTVSLILGMAVVPFWLFYVLQDQSKVTRSVAKLFPQHLRADLFSLTRIVDSILSAYLRGQLLLCLFIGIMATVGLSLLGVQFAVVLGLIAGIFEILPFIGPVIGMVPALIVALIQSPILGLWTLLLFVGIQQVENLFLVPRISGRAVQLHPALIMVVLVIGNELAGLWGMLLAVPATAIFRDVFKYLYLRFQDNPPDPGDALEALGRTPVDVKL